MINALTFSGGSWLLNITAGGSVRLPDMTEARVAVMAVITNKNIKAIE